MTTNAYFALSYCSALELLPLIRDIEEFSNCPFWFDPLDVMGGEAIGRQNDFGNEDCVG
jgi:hypothetical protein